MSVTPHPPPSPGFNPALHGLSLINNIIGPAAQVFMLGRAKKSNQDRQGLSASKHSRHSYLFDQPDASVTGV